jgi:hypothetical protein
VDYQGNSKKEKEEKEKKEKPKLEKVIEGEAVEKPKGIGHKFRSIFFGGEFKSATRYILADVLLPAARNAIVDATTKGIERMVYGDRYAEPGRRPEMRSRVQYNSPVQRGRSYSSSMIPDQPPHRPVRTNRKEANDILIPNRADADRVLEHMITIVEQYEVASLADLYDLLGMPTAHVDNKWGWYNLNDSAIRQVREGYLLELPPLEEI